MVDFYGLYKKLPGGMLLVPMFVVAAINTLFPELFTSLGGMTAALFKTGTLAFAALILFATGATVSVKSLGTVIKRSGALSIMKLVISFGAGILFINLFGMEGVAGINAIAFVTCICSCNPGVFAGLMQDYGETEDMGNFAMMNILSMPCFPLLVLAAASGGGFNWLEIVTVIVPFVLGMIMGNLDPHFSKVYAATTPIALPFMGCCFGGSLNLIAAVQAGISGVMLAAKFLVIHVVLMVGTDRIVNRRPGYAAAAWCSVAGIAMTVPSMLGGGAYDQLAAAASAQIALCVIVTSLVSPFITRAVVAKWGCPKVPLEPQGQEEASA